MAMYPVYIAVHVCAWSCCWNLNPTSILISLWTNMYMYEPLKCPCNARDAMLSQSNAFEVLLQLSAVVVVTIFLSCKMHIN